MGSDMSDKMIIGILLSWFSERLECGDTIATLRTIQEDMAKWPYATNIFIGDVSVSKMKNYYGELKGNGSSCRTFDGVEDNTSRAKQPKAINENMLQI